MTLDELIKELNEVKKKKGGNVQVVFVDDTGYATVTDCYLDEQIVTRVIIS